MSEDSLGIKGYQYDPNLRFNFPNKKHKVTEAKMRRVFDVHIDREKKLPGPFSYKSSAHRTNFNDITKRSKIYTQDRKSAIDIITKGSRWVPGIGKYKVDAYDEKVLKPPKGTYKQKCDRITFHDECMLKGKESGGLPEPSNLVSNTFVLINLDSSFRMHTIRSKRDHQSGEKNQKKK